MAGETSADRPARRLTDGPKRQASFWLPVSLCDKLDTLISAAKLAGERTTRTEMLSAILFHAEVELDPETRAMGEFLRSYRVATDADVQIPLSES